MKIAQNIDITFENQDMIVFMKQLIKGFTWFFVALSLTIGFSIYWPKFQYIDECMVVAFTLFLSYIQYKIYKIDKREKLNSCKHEGYYKMSKGKYKNNFKCLYCGKILLDKDIKIKRD